MSRLPTRVHACHRWSRRLRVALLLICTSAATHGEAINYTHVLSFPYDPHYPASFEHFDYVNPDAPKGGTLRLAVGGTYDSFNNFIHKGRPAAGMSLTGEENLFYDRLLVRSADEPTARYGGLADGVAVADDASWVAFRLREGAYWHDGEPLTADDFVFSFETFKSVGSVTLRSLLAGVSAIEVLNPREIRYVLAKGTEFNPNTPLVLADLPVLPKHYWAARDPSLTTLEPPLASGPYRIKSFDLGRKVTYERVGNYWGRDLPVNRGRWNFDEISFEYFRDVNVAREAMKSGYFDVHQEGVAKSWTVEYDIPIVREGLMVKELLQLSRPAGLWWSIHWNLRLARFQDRRVRHALHLLYNDVWINGVQNYGYYDRGFSVFQGSSMAHSGRPEGRERALLETHRGVIPDAVFEREYAPQHPNDLSEVRSKIVEALALFAEAGWDYAGGRLVHRATGEQFSIEFVVPSIALVRSLLPYIDVLRDVGINASARSLEASNWLYRMQKRTFSAAMRSTAPTNLPGLQLRNLFGSASADQAFGLNWGGISDPAVDDLIDHVIAAEDVADFLAATRALDRVLLWQFYFVPRSSPPGFRLLYWDRFGIPEHGVLQHPVHYDVWWFDPEKDVTLQRNLEALQR